MMRQSLLPSLSVRLPVSWPGSWLEVLVSDTPSDDGDDGGGGSSSGC